MSTVPCVVAETLPDCAGMLPVASKAEPVKFTARGAVPELDLAEALAERVAGDTFKTRSAVVSATEPGRPAIIRVATITPSAAKATHTFE